MVWNLVRLEPTRLRLRTGRPPDGLKALVPVTDGPCLTGPRATGGALVPSEGFEPSTFASVVRRSLRWATRAVLTWLDSNQRHLG